ncbi:rod shape-determining protein MreC [Candidatus Uhrbacteria bacterium]|nr:rod shape-determining protein MreC [Candidatus Uhrbacteria bacterium]
MRTSVFFRFSWKRLLFIALILLLPTGIWRFSETARSFSFFLSGIAEASASVGERFQLFFFGPGEWRILKGEQQSWAVDRAELARLSQENAELRAELQYQEREGFAPLTARIVARSSFADDERFLLDRGTQDGIRSGMALVSGTGLLVGNVRSVDLLTSVGIPSTHPDFSVTVSPLSRQRTVGLARGDGNGLIRLTFIPKDEPLAVGDLLVTSGLDPDIKSGLIVGIVNRVIDVPGSLFKEAILEPLSDSRWQTMIQIERSPRL